MIRFLVCMIAALPLCAVAQNNAISWNKVFTGDIGKYPVTLYLQKTGKIYCGYYYYNSQQKPMHLGSYHNTQSDSISLSAYEDDKGEYLEGIYNGTIYSGVWKNVIGEKTVTLNFSFTENKTPPPPNFDVVYTDYETEYPAGLKKGENPGYSYFSAALWPAAGTAEPLAGFLKKWVSQVFGNKNAALPIGKFFIDDKNKDLAAWKKDLAAIKKSELMEYPNENNVSSERKLMIMYQDRQHVCIADASYAFTGGAHGNGGTSMHVLDITKYKELKLNDVFTTAGKQKLLLLLDAAVRTKFNIPKGKNLDEADAGLLVKKIELTENFYLTGKGIGFNYMPYEIAAYAYGEINLFLPFEQLKGMLQVGLGK